MFTSDYRNIKGLKFSMKKNQNVSNCIKALPLQETGIKLKTQFGFAAEIYKIT